MFLGILFWMTPKVSSISTLLLLEGGVPEGGGGR